ncbi:hypothetical protein JN00_0274 [Metamycoplasma subdolum]|uniref:Uncharacterized protein n=1 Tax=Metamycoplasma subdolum TaxID=92407 RepID=A0A3M0AHC9_9BACT|nr:hypothetical protein [Metamycoplasma subdolum]RMA78632.1 hypothetical protein JN00_0274 [Metamycoplasma subdolum]WPB50766.1 hypothetical protein R9C05_01300 [Metamycoplasma subdolum]
MEYINVNTRMNMIFQVEKEAIYNSLKSIFDDIKNIKLVSEIEININSSKTNVTIKLSYRLSKTANFSFETKKLISLIEQKLFSLINTKPNNINLIYAGVYDEI